MSIPFYMDEHIPYAITRGIRRRGIDVLTVQEDGAEGTRDIEVLDRALHLGRVTVSNDKDFQIEAARRQHLGQEFAGVVIVDLSQITIGRCVSDLELIGLAGEPSDLMNRIEYLPY